ncbi:hypothetical protein ACFQNJ_02650 [Hydrogenophaga bisanensis]|uniref:Mannitol repressor n=1 Tax=Hydrogenophaga bisanensis TaxID=439611 RepID=A0ABW2R5C5_9BURK
MATSNKSKAPTAPAGTTPTPAPSDEKKTDDPERLEVFKAFVMEFAKESDRACVILGAARLDILLKQLITAVLLPSTSSSDELLDGDSPLGTFSARIQMSYRLGLLDAEFTRALNLIRRIRNEFAHEASSVSLAHASHRDRIKQLIAPLKDIKIFGTFREMDLLKPHEGSARDFRAILAFLCARLEGAVHRAAPVKSERTCALVAKKWLEKPSSDG